MMCEVFAYFLLGTQACEATMETHTLARYFSEHSLQEYEFVMEKPSYIAAASMYLALRMKKLGGWVRSTITMCDFL